MPISIDKTECVFDAQGGLHNSLDYVASQAEQKDQVAARKSLFIDPANHDSVSFPFIGLEEELCQSPRLLEIRTERFWKAPQQLKEEIEIRKREATALATAGDPGEVNLGGLQLFDTRTTYFIHNVKASTSLLLGGSNTEDWVVTDEDRQKFNVSLEELKQYSDMAAAPALPLSATMVDWTEFKPAIEAINLSENLTCVSMDPKQWVCGRCGRQGANLWLNLADGHIGCGRKQYALEDSGCVDGLEGAAITHHAEHPAFGVVVKLGTISPYSADVYSYDMESFVELDDLDDYLLRLGLNRSKLAITQKTTAELALEKNQALSFGITDIETNKASGVHGQGLMGMVNIGNSCYIGSLMQLLALVVNDEKSCWQPPKNMSWLQACLSLRRSLGRFVPRTDIVFQLLRLVQALNGPVESLVPAWQKVHNDRYDYLSKCLPAEDMACVSRVDSTLEAGNPSPTLLKRIVGVKHGTFATPEQQDVEEFYQLLYTMATDNEKKLKSDQHPWGLEELLGLRLNRKIISKTDGTVEFVPTQAPLISLQLPQGAERENVGLLDLIATWRTHQSNILSHQKEQLIDFPPYLMIHIQRMTVDDQHQVVKVNSPVNIPDVMSLEFLREEGLLEGEKLALEKPIQAAEELRMFGFNEDQIQAAAETLGKEAPTDQMVNWIVEHPDARPTVTFGAESDDLGNKIKSLAELGVEPSLCRKALVKYQGDLERAGEALMMGEDFSALQEPQAPKPFAARNTGRSSYRLCGLIVHLGGSTHCGHYVAYVKRNGRWYLYNDVNVSLCEGDIDTRFGYLYLYALE